MTSGNDANTCTCMYVPTRERLYTQNMCVDKCHTYMRLRVLHAYGVCMLIAYVCFCCNNISMCNPGKVHPLNL